MAQRGLTAHPDLASLVVEGVTTGRHLGTGSYGSVEEVSYKYINYHNTTYIDICLFFTIIHSRLTSVSYCTLERDFIELCWNPATLEPKESLESMFNNAS